MSSNLQLRASGKIEDRKRIGQNICVTLTGTFVRTRDAQMRDSSVTVSRR